MKRFLSNKTIWCFAAFLMLAIISVGIKSSRNGFPFILGLIINLLGWALLFGLFYWINPQHWYTKILVVVLYLVIVLGLILVISNIIN